MYISFIRKFELKRPKNWSKHKQFIIKEPTIFAMSQYWIAAVHGLPQRILYSTQNIQITHNAMSTIATKWMLMLVECFFPVLHPKNTSGNTKMYPLSFILVMSCLAALSKALQLVTTLIPKVLKSPTQPQTAWEFQPPFYNCGFMLPPHAHKLWQ